MRRTASSDSLDWPWRSFRRKRRIVVVEDTEHRGFDFESFLLCFVAVFLLASGIILLTVHIWNLVKMRTFCVLLQVRLDITYFSIPAAILAFPCSWIAVSLHNSNKKAKLLPLLFIFLGIAIALMIAASCIGILLVPTELSSDNKTTKSNVLTHISASEINATIYNFIINYDSQFVQEKISYFDSMQQNLQCCGSRNFRDFVDNGRTVPTSCCPNYACEGSSMSNKFQTGCTESLNRAFIWHSNTLNSLNWAFVCIAICAMALCSVVLWSLHQLRRQS